MLYSPFIPLQLSEGNALSTDPLQTEAKGTISSALHTEDRTLKTAHSSTQFQYSTSHLKSFKAHDGFSSFSRSQGQSQTQVPAPSNC